MCPPLPCYSLKRLLRKQLIPSSGALIFAVVLQGNSPDLLVQRPAGIVIMTPQDCIDLHTSTAAIWGSELPWWLSGKESACSAGELGSVPGLGRSLGGGNGNPLQYSCLRNPVDRGAWQGTVHGVAKSWTRLSTHTHTHTHTHKNSSHTDTNLSAHKTGELWITSELHWSQFPGFACVQ